MAMEQLSLFRCFRAATLRKFEFGWTTILMGHAQLRRGQDLHRFGNGCLAAVRQATAAEMGEASGSPEHLELLLLSGVALAVRFTLPPGMLAACIHQRLGLAIAVALASIEGARGLAKTSKTQELQSQQDMLLKITWTEVLQHVLSVNDCCQHALLHSFNVHFVRSGGLGGTIVLPAVGTLQNGYLELLKTMTMTTRDPAPTGSKLSGVQFVKEGAVLSAWQRPVDFKEVFEHSDCGRDRLGITCFRFLRLDTIEDIYLELCVYILVHRGLTRDPVRKVEQVIAGSAVLHSGSADRKSNFDVWGFVGRVSHITAAPSRPPVLRTQQSRELLQRWGLFQHRSPWT